jgi:hypothetical protein
MLFYASCAKSFFFLFHLCSLRNNITERRIISSAATIIIWVYGSGKLTLIHMHACAD